MPLTPTATTVRPACPGSTGDVNIADLTDKPVTVTDEYTPKPCRYCGTGQVVEVDVHGAPESDRYHLVCTLDLA